VTPTLDELPAILRRWATELGFQQLGITDIDLGEHPKYLRHWLAAGHHGSMTYMERHENLRANPQLLVPGTLRIIVARMDYLTEEGRDGLQNLGDPTKGYISRYALGRDYHKVVRRRLASLAARLRKLRPDAEVRAFCDSAPVMEKALAQKAGLGWIGKNTLLLNPESGSWFFLGEIFTSLPLPVDKPQQPDRCGSCRACLDVCPTGAFKGPQQLDARRCIAYLTIENKEDIPVELRGLMGNRIFGCDDCQWVCPWTRYAGVPAVDDFKPRSVLHDVDLLVLFAWSEEEFRRHTEGTALRRISFGQWLRNLAVALGNAPPSPAIVKALRDRLQDNVCDMVKRHIRWALERQDLALREV